MTRGPVRPIDLVRFGPFFSVDVHESGAPPTPPWIRLSDLLDDAPIRARVEQVRGGLAAMTGSVPGQVDPRVSASVAHLGLVARLLAPALGAASSGSVLSMDLDDLWWQPQLGGPFPLSVVMATAADADPPGDQLALDIDGPVRRLTETVHAAYGVSRRVLWGNVASAVNSATSLLVRADPAAGREATRIALSLLGRSPLNAQAPIVGPAFRRNSCCLIYRLSATDRGAARSVCGDCVLADEFTSTR